MGKTLSALARRERRLIAQTRADAIAWTLQEVAHKFGSAEATPAQWLECLNFHATDHARQSPEWVTTPNDLGRVVRVLQPGLQLLGVEITFRRRGNARLWRVETAQRAAARRHLETTRSEHEAARIAHREREKGPYSIN